MHEHLFITKLNTFPMICQFIIVYIKLKLIVNWSSQKGAHAMSETVVGLPGATETRRKADAADFPPKKGARQENKYCTQRGQDMFLLPGHDGEVLGVVP